MINRSESRLIAKERRNLAAREALAEKRTRTSETARTVKQVKTRSRDH